MPVNDKMPDEIQMFGNETAGYLTRTNAALYIEEKIQVTLKQD